MSIPTQYSLCPSEIVFRNIWSNERKRENLGKSAKFKINTACPDSRFRDAARLLAFGKMEIEISNMLQEIELIK